VNGPSIVLALQKESAVIAFDGHLGRLSSDDVDLLSFNHRLPLCTGIVKLSNFFIEKCWIPLRQNCDL